MLYFKSASHREASADSLVLNNTALTVEVSFS